jgi:ribosomal protein L24E
MFSDVFSQGKKSLFVYFWENHSQRKIFFFAVNKCEGNGFCQRKDVVLNWFKEFSKEH